MPRIFRVRLIDIQPSQLYVSSAKLTAVIKSFVPEQPESLVPVPLKELDQRVIFTDGHTRALAAYLAGLSEVDAFWDEDELDWEAYRICMNWCREEGINTIADLRGRVVSPIEYGVLWLERCRKMQDGLKKHPLLPRKGKLHLE